MGKGKGFVLKTKRRVRSVEYTKMCKLDETGI
jgi:hypothetical protein